MKAIKITKLRLNNLISKDKIKKKIKFFLRKNFKKDQSQIRLIFEIRVMTPSYPIEGKHEKIMK
jgi:hypothetical protein